MRKNAPGGSDLHQPDDRVGTQLGCHADGLVKLWGWLIVEHNHRPVLLVLVEDLGGGQGAQPGTAATFDIDDNPHFCSPSQVTGSSWTP